jgi:hypothetical protein
MRPCSPSQDALRRLQLMSRELYVKVPGVPVPQGSMSCINGVMFHSNKHLPIWRSKVQKALECEFVGGAFSGPIYAYLTFILPRPASVTRISPVSSRIWTSWCVRSSTRLKRPALCITTRRSARCTLLRGMFARMRSLILRFG